MGVRFCVLGSGSSGNATLITAPNASVLIDPGFSPDELARRMKGTDVSWSSLSAVVLTHTHGDHLKMTCLRRILENNIPFYCHADHLRELEPGRYTKRLSAAGLIHTYQNQVPFEVADGEFLFFPLDIPHDRPPTFGFRVETTDHLGQLRKMGYLCDLGEWTPEMVEHVKDVDLLALEFNHDEQLQRNSGRHPKLIARVLGRNGHLSNHQSSRFLEHLLTIGTGGGPKQLVQMHLSGECNRPELAYQAAHQVIHQMGANVSIFSSRQDQRGTIHSVGVPK